MMSSESDGKSVTFESAATTQGTEVPAVGGTQDVFYASDNTVPLPMIERAAGIYLWDVEGNEYIDVSSGPVVSNIGHGNPRVIEAMAAQARKVDYAFSRVARHRANLDYAARLAQLAGPGFERVSLASGGSEAMENAIKFLRQYVVATGRASKRKIISCLPSYHGATLAMLAIGGGSGLDPFLSGMAVTSETVPAPFSYRLPADHSRESYANHCAAALERKIEELGAENVLAFVIEPVGGLSTGCVVPTDDYFRSIREICTRHGVYLVFDEVLCGVGRTGRFLAAHHWPDALPDIVALAKALGAGYAPLGAMLAPAAMVDELAALTGFEFAHSYNASPIACAAGLAVLDELDRQGLVAAAAERGTTLRTALKTLQMRSPIVGDVRGLGLLLAVELVANQETKAPLPLEFMATERIRMHGLRNGLMIYSRRTAGGKFGDWFIVAPPLTITAAESDELVQRLEATLADLARS